MTAKIKKVWIRFKDEKAYFGENENKLCTLLRENPGDCTAFVYIEDTKKHRELCGYYFNESKIDLLIDAFGEENVKYQEKDIPVREDWEYKESFENLLIRIADALEDISESIKKREHY